MYKTYQYKIVVHVQMSENELNEYGKDGWENYAVEGNRFYFKREGKPKEVKPLMVTANGLPNNNNAAKVKR